MPLASSSVRKRKALALRFLSPRNVDVARRMSTPTSVLPPVPSGLPRVTMAPTQDCSKRFRLTRAASRFCPSSRLPSSKALSRARVWTSSTPTLKPDCRPTIFVPARIGTSRSFSRPIRRLKKGSTLSSLVAATSNTPAPSRKNARFSGKNSGNRVRLIWRSSASVSAKSVLTVTDAFMFGVRFLKMSRPACSLLSPVSRPPERYGRMSRPSPWLIPSIPSSRPACERFEIQASRWGDAHRSVSLCRLISRSTLNPHTVWPGLKRSVLKGMAISAVHPSGVIRAAASQMPSHWSDSSSALLATWPSALAPDGFTWKKNPFRWSKNGSRMMRTLSSLSSSASRVSWVETMADGVRSRQRMPT